MANEVATSKQFQERVFERIRDSIGELMTEDELRGVLDVAMQKAFFEERRVLSTSPYRDDVVQEPILVEMTRDLLRDQVRKAMDAWLEENKSEVAKIIDQVVREGIVKVVSDHFDSLLANGMHQLGSELRNQLQVS